MFNTPGFIKFFWPNQYVENRYNNVYEIPVMNINKEIFKLDPKKDQEFILIHISDLKKDAQVIKQVLKSYANNVYILPDQNCTATFQEIKKVYPNNALGKMITTGQEMHPLIKFLKRNCYSLYQYSMFGAKKTQPTCAYFKNANNKIEFFQGLEFSKFVTKRFNQSSIQPEAQIK